ncbi:MAG: tryptophan--tRNA ligase [Candidatus Micrarchaeota archaeon]|nr:tryptophan--tRNA ligase [Candidatus Micrarchaeota archaeon]
MPEKIVDAWGSSEVKIDAKLISQFGLKQFSQDELKHYKHYLFERGIIVAHRDFGLIDGRIKNKQKFLQVTGIAATGPLHLGHKVDVDLFVYLNSLGAKSYFVVSDIDAYTSRPSSSVPSMEAAKENAAADVADLLALGVEKSDIYVQSRKEPRYYEFAFELSKILTENEIKAIYGSLNPGKIAANLLQYADILHPQLKEFDGPMPSITGIGIEQDPHARAVRDIAHRLPYKFFSPSFIYFTHLPGLQQDKKMSKSEPDTAIFLGDSAKDIKRKINKAYSGGKDSVEEQRKYGANVEIDRAFAILNYHHPDTEFVNDVREKYSSGKMLSGELKQICTEFLTEMLAKHQEKVEKSKTTAEKIVYG